MPAHLALKSMDPEVLEEAIEQYFEERVSTRMVYPRNGEPFEEEWIKPPTFSGIARAVGISRMTLWRYIHRREDLAPEVLLVLTRACEKVQEMVEEATFNRETYQGARFALEVNHRFGKEDEGASGGAFNQTIVTPQIEGDDPLAIPDWSEE